MKGLLSFSRKGLAEVEDVDLNALAREEAQLLERTTLAKVCLELDLEEGLPIIQGETSALGHVLMNLCVNAVDAMGDNGRLILRTRCRGDEVLIEVEDNGCGMPPEVLNKAMEPFFTTKSQGKGTGLGLSIAYNTVLAHGGTLKIFSVPGQGTCIQLRFPVPVALVQESLEAIDPPVEQELTEGSLARHVLLVDDDELVVASVQNMVELLGYGTTVAGSGEEALVKLDAGLQVVAVILDMNMPGLGGAGTLGPLRLLRPDLPVLLATGRVEQSVLDLLKAHSGVTLMSKPFTMVELRGHLSRIIESSGS